jgi:Ca2+-binding RTX toxin-like protein
VPGQPRTFTFSAFSPSPTDQAAGFSYAINWGDGHTQSITATAGNGAGTAVDHIYTAPGSYTVKVTDTDDDGTSPVVSKVVTVQPVEMEGSLLAVGGTTRNDTITLTPADTTGDINVTLNGVSLGNFKPSDHILVYTQTGNDTVTLASTKIKGTAYYITVAAFLYGGGTGKNNDILDTRGSTANNVLVGGAGNNTLYGGLGRDLLLAGLGASTIYSGSADDIMIGGWTGYADMTSSVMTYAQQLTALEAIMAEWGSSDSYATRVSDLTSGGGLNGSCLLNASTVHENGKADTLYGTTGSSLDWFFVGATDIIKNKKSGEVLTPIT